MIGTAHGGQDRWHYERQDRWIKGLVRKLVGKGQVHTGFGEETGWKRTGAYRVW